jgi:hypothetical protein
MDILQQLVQLLDDTPQHNHSAPPLTRKQLVAIVTEIRRLRTVEAELATAEADAQARTDNNPNL